MSSDEDPNYPETMPVSETIGDYDDSFIPDMPHVQIAFLDPKISKLFAKFVDKPITQLYYRLPLFACVNESIHIPINAIGCVAINTGIELTVPKHYSARIGVSVMSTYSIDRPKLITSLENAMDEPLILYLDNFISPTVILPGQLIAYVRFWYIYKKLEIQSRFHLHVLE